MLPATLFPDLITLTAQQRPGTVAPTHGAEHLTYARLTGSISVVASGLLQLCLKCADRIRAGGQKNLISECHNRMPGYMLPADIDWVAGPLPRNANGKIDRAALAQDWLARHSSAPQTPPSGR